MRTVILLLLVVATAISAPAATLFVSPDGSGTYPSIQAAVDAANSGDTVFLMPGTFTGPGNRDIEIDFDITIRSNSIDDRAVIDCQGSAADPHRGFNVNDMALTLEYVTVRNGYGPNGGAAYISGGTPIFNHCLFEDNTATQNGGAFYIDGAEVVRADHCIFGSNSAAGQGGAVYAGADLEVQLMNCTLFRNAAPNGSGVYYGSNAFLRVNSSIIAYGVGGGAVSDYYSAGIVIGCTDIFGNQGGDWTGSLAGQLNINNNISVDPIFCDPMARPANYALMLDSPVGYSNACGALGAKLPDPAWPAPVYYLTADGNGMFNTIQAALDEVGTGSTIKLDAGNYTGDGNRDLDFLTKEIVVEAWDPSGDYPVIDAEGSSTNPHRILWVHGGQSLASTLKHLVLRNGYTEVGSLMPHSGFGAGIMITDMSSLTIEDVVFENHYTNWGASAIHAIGPDSDLVVRNCQFTGHQQGLLMADSCGLIMDGCSIDESNNNGILVTGVSQGVSISNSTILGWEGGQILISDVLDTPVTIENCEVTAPQTWNTPLFLDNASAVEVNNSRIVMTATSELCTGVKITRTNATFTDCSFISQPGAVYITAVNTSQESHARFVNCSFEDFASVYYDRGTLTFLGGQLEVEGCTFTNNQNGILCQGPDIASLSVLNSSFANAEFNFIDIDSTTVPVIISGCDFTNAGNLVSFNAVTSGSVLNSTFSGSTAGPALELAHSNVYVDHCDFSGSVQGLRAFQVPDFRLANSTFTDNPDSGAVELSFVSGSVDTCSFERNYADHSGGAMALDNVDLMVKDCNFTDNTSNTDGGAVFVESGNTNFSRCDFDGNRANRNGGAWAGYSGAVGLSYCDFNGNSSGLAGGAVYSWQTDADFTYCTMTGGHAQNRGGGANHFVGTITYNFCEFSGNSAPFGGALYSMSADVTGSDLEVLNNGSVVGGALQFSDGTGQIFDSLLAGNTSMTKGGAVTATTGALTAFQGCTIVGNGGEGSQGQVLVEDASSASFVRSIVAFGLFSPAAAQDNAASTVTIQQSNVFGNAGGDWVGPLLGQDSSGCNLTADPLFCDPASGNYHLSAASPCLSINNICGLYMGALGQGCNGVSPVPDQVELPSTFTVLGNFPNPFNPRTDISFELPVAGPVRVQIYDVTGRKVRSLVAGQSFEAGSHQVTWDGTDDRGKAQSSGIYLYRVTAEGRTLGGKMALIR